MVRILYLMISVIVFVAGCGYKGPLVLPEKPVVVKESTGESNSKDAKQKKP